MKLIYSLTLWNSWTRFSFRRAELELNQEVIFLEYWQFLAGMLRKAEATAWNSNYSLLVQYHYKGTERIYIFGYIKGGIHRRLKFLFQSSSNSEVWHTTFFIGSATSTLFFSSLSLAYKIIVTKVAVLSMMWPTPEKSQYVYWYNLAI